MTDAQPLWRTDGFLPLEDYGLIGDGRTAALVGRDGGVGWLCLPRFDAEPVLCGLLDPGRGGVFSIVPDDLVGSHQRYDRGTGILVTRLHSRGGVVEVVDLFPLRSGADLHEDVASTRGELLRAVRVVEGSVVLRVTVRLRGQDRAEPHVGGWRLHLRGRRDLELHLLSSVQLEGPESTLELSAGDRLYLRLDWSGRARGRRADPERLLAETARVWRAWSADVRYEGPRADLVHRSAITLKLLDHWEGGAIVAAPTSSLPEAIGGPRNWDYRYTWVRDAAFSVYALRRIGLGAEAEGFLAWVLDAVERDGRPRILYDLDGAQPPPEREDDSLTGYRRSRPVRWGNAAAGQAQHDVYGEIVDCAYQWTRGGRDVDPVLWRHVHDLAEAAAQRWRLPDHGIWEIRRPGRPFTYSVAMCWVALDRAARLADGLGAASDARRWRSRAAVVREALLREAWSEDLQSLTEHLATQGHPPGGLDGSLLALPLRRLLAADDPRMVSTMRAVTDRLGAGKGLVYRYMPDESPDGLAGDEGAFLLCSFWLVDNLTGQGRLDEASALFDDLCDRAGPLGLLPEQIDPGSGLFLGNYPQAFSHVGVISSGVRLAAAYRSAAVH